MTTKFENGLFIFRRDFRIIDNNALNLLNERCDKVFTIFIFTPEQVGSGNKYKSDNSVQFMIESLQDLAGQISRAGGHLYTFFGHNDEIVEQCIQDFKINVVCYNLDITPYAKERDAKIVRVCERTKTYVMYDHDYYLHEPGVIVNSTGGPYQKFTPYYQAALKLKVDPPARASKMRFAQTTAHIANRLGLTEALHNFTHINLDILVHGGRSNAIKQLKTAAKNIQNYPQTHNSLNHPTSQLSAFIKFGCVSVREVYKTFRTKRDFIRQLFWRDFYANVLYSFPHVLGHSMKPKYDKVKWHFSARWFDAWCNGTTGFPVVDAGMRQLNKTGYMHNRARLIVASFLVKTLLIDWQRGEQYFATKLTDYDPASNNLNWQWCASSAVDSQPYFRIFNPWRQAENFDPDCEYIKEWVPELAALPAKDILNWETKWTEFPDISYPKPICDYNAQKDKALAMLGAVFK